MTNATRAATTFDLLVALMELNGLRPPPSIQAYRAALHWWDHIEARERKLWNAIGLEHVRQWWTVSAAWKQATREWNAANGATGDDLMFAFEFEHVTAICDMGNLAWAQKKSFGQLVRIRPVEPTDPHDPQHVGVIHKQSSPWRQKWAQRDLLKRQLPGSLRSVINKARSMPFHEFQTSCEGGWSRGQKRQIGYVDDRRTAQMLLSPARDPCVRISDIEIDCESGEVQATVSRNHDPDERFQTAASRLCRRHGWSLNGLWRHIRGLDLLAREILFRPQEHQRSLFSIEQ